MSSDLKPWQDWSQGLDLFDISKTDEETLNARDVVGKLISGHHTAVAFRRNFLRCAFRSAIIEDSNWTDVDFKDSVFVETTFDQMKLGSGSTVSCTYSGCKFIDCDFEGAAIHDCVYIECSFIRCNFENTMIRNCRITSSIFDHCITSNKLFDGCRIYKNSFLHTLVDFRAIIDNFGVSDNQINQNYIREDRAYPEVRIFEFDKYLSSAEWHSSLTPIEKIKIQYYFSSGVLVGSDSVDDAFQPGAWLALVRGPINLVRLLNDFSEFIFLLYEDEKAPAVFLIKLAQLSNELWVGFHSSSLHGEISQIAAGVYLKCLQQLVELEANVALSLPLSGADKITLRSSNEAADDDVQYISSEIRELLPTAHILIMPRNSPVDIVITNLNINYTIAIITLFFSTKTKIELKRSLDDSGKSVKNSKEIFSLALGGAKHDSLQEAFSINSALPGALLIRLQIHYSTALVDKIKSTIREIIS